MSDFAQGIDDSCETEAEIACEGGGCLQAQVENDRLNLQERNNIETFSREISRSSSGYSSERSNSQTIESEDVTESYNLDMLRKQLSCLTTNGSTNGDESFHLLDNESQSDTSTKQESNSASVAPVVHEATEDDFDSTDSIKFPSPPTASPGLGETSAQNFAPVSAISSDAVDSISSRTSIDSYVWSSADSGLPSWSLNDDEEKLIWPLEVEFSVTDTFEEDHHYVIYTEIGGGAFGKCYLGSVVTADDKEEGRVFCVKKCQFRYNELLALRVARKANIAEIIGFYGAKLKGTNACIFMEFMAGGTIADLIQEEKSCGNASWPTLSETNSLGFLEDVLKAVKFLHTKGIVHKDIKGDNVLLDENRLRAKLTDFGSAESFMDAKPSIDIWGTACLLLEMLNGRRPSTLFIKEGGLQRQNSCNPEDYIPIQAMEVTKELLRFCFGLKKIERNSLPSAAEVLKYSEAFPVAELLKRLSNPST